jgi:hypothetical protein
MSENIWSCKIGGDVGDGLPRGADGPMRDAVADAFERISGKRPEFIFSGWGAELTEGERAVHENREASPEYYAKLKLEAAAPELLEALQALMESRRRDQYKGWEEGCPDFHKSEALAKAAIAKATE